MPRSGTPPSVHAVGSHPPDELLRLDGRSTEAFTELVHDLQAIDASAAEIQARIVDGAARVLAVDTAWLSVRTASHAEASRVVAAHGDWIGEPIAMTSRSASERAAMGFEVRDEATRNQGVPAELRGMAAREGFAAMAWARVADRGDEIGRLHVARRRPVPLTAGERELLGRIAQHGCLALRHAQAYRELAERRERLGVWLAMHGEMGAATVRDIGLSGVLEMVASMLGLEVVLEVMPDARREVPEAVRAPVPAGTPRAGSWPVLVGDDEVGTLHALGEVPLTEMQIGVVRYGARLVAIEILKSRGAADSEARLRAGLLEKLLDGGDRADPEIATRAARLGVALDVPRRVFAFACEGERPDLGLGEVARRAGETAAGPHLGSLEAQHEGCVIVALPDAAGGGAGFAEMVQSRMQARGAVVTVGIAQAGIDLAVAGREALACLRLAARAPRSGAIVDATRLGSLYFLLDAPSLEVAAALVEEDLRRLRHLDARARIPLLDTLRAWVRSDGRTAEAARLCGVHPSTLKYRIGRAQSVLGVSLSDRNVRLQLGLALELAAFLEGLGLKPGGTT
jgi:sugar diacid utilization regulator